MGLAIPAEEFLQGWRYALVRLALQVSAKAQAGSCIAGLGRQLHAQASDCEKVVVVCVARPAGALMLWLVRRLPMRATIVPKAAHAVRDGSGGLRFTIIQHSAGLAPLRLTALPNVKAGIKAKSLAWVAAILRGR